jgi:Uma2 family endonuclease
MAVTQTPKVVHYPESDGKPMAETQEHLDAMLYLIGALQTYFAQREDVYVAGNQFLYWVEGNPNQRVAPDVYVVFGVPKRPPRPVWKVWEEGKAPDVIMEVTSRSTAPEDFGRKYRLYERLGVKEYFLVDVTREYLMEPVILYRLRGTEYAQVACEQFGEREWRAYSEQLGLYVVVRWEVDRYRTRLYQPVEGRYLPRFDEVVAAYREQVRLTLELRQRVQEEARRAEEEARRAEEEARRAEEEARRAEEEARRAEEEARRAEEAIRRAEEEARARREAERRLRELEEELRRLKGHASG